MDKKLLFSALSAAVSCLPMAAATSGDLDFSRIRTWVGDGEKESAVVLSWNDGKGMDNLVVGLRHDVPFSSAEEVLSMFVGADRRFYLPEGAPEGSLCFDNGGEGKLSDEEYTMFDHRGIPGAEGSWQMTEDMAGENTVYMLSFVEDGSDFGGTVPYLFYLPEESVIGAWLPDRLDLVLSDVNAIVPAYINTGAGNAAANVTVSMTTAEKKIVGSMGYAESSALLGRGDSRLIVKFATFKAGDEIAAHCGEVSPKLQLRYKKAGATSAVAATATTGAVVAVSEPEPLLGLAFSEEEPRVKVTEKYPLELAVPEGSGAFSGGITFTYSNLDNPSGIAQGYLQADQNNRRKFTVSPNKQCAGRMQVTASSIAYPEITAECVIDFYAGNPITAVSVGDFAGQEIHVGAYVPEEYMYNAFPMAVKVEPADADIPVLRLRTSLDDEEEGPIVKASYQKGDKSYDVTSVAFGTALPNNEVYSAPYEKKFTSLVESYEDLAQYTEPRSCTAWFESQDGSNVRSEEFTIVVDPRDFSPAADGWQDGTFWINEEWYGHTNGSMNYITAQGDVLYRPYQMQNPGYNFGCTSQYGFVYGDRLYVISKQDKDGGDRYRNGGGRLVVADAKTLKRITPFDQIGLAAAGTSAAQVGDGRAGAGVRPDKIYIGHHKGIRVLNIDLEKAESSDPAEAASAFTLGKQIAVGGEGSKGLYEGQTGDMVCAGKYVYVVTQSDGLVVIDGDTDEVVGRLGTDFRAEGAEKAAYSVQGVAMTADGHVWFAETDTRDSGLKTWFVEVDPLTAEVISSHLLPEGAGTVNTGWGAWRSANFFASKKRNVLYWGNVGSGYKDDILGKGTGCIFRWETDKDMPQGPFYTIPERSVLVGTDPKTKEDVYKNQVPYATMRYDDRTDEVLMATSYDAANGYNYFYRYCWLYFIDGTTGAENRVIDLQPYFWFPSIPVFPDKYAPVFDGLTGIMAGKDPVVIDLYEYVSDEDGLDRAINLSVEEPAVETRSGERLFDYTLENGILTVTPKSKGEGMLTLVAESNGKVTRQDVKVSTLYSGVEWVGYVSAISVSGNVVTIEGMAGSEVTVYDINGRVAETIDVVSDRETHVMDLPAGIYIVKGAGSNATAKVIL